MASNSALASRKNYGWWTWQRLEQPEQLEECRNDLPVFEDASAPDSVGERSGAGLQNCPLDDAIEENLLTAHA